MTKAGQTLKVLVESRDDELSLGLLKIDGEGTCRIILRGPAHHPHSTIPFHVQADEFPRMTSRREYCLENTSLRLLEQHAFRSLNGSGTLWIEDENALLILTKSQKPASDTDLFALGQGKILFTPEEQFFPFTHASCDIVSYSKNLSFVKKSELSRLTLSAYNSTTPSLTVEQPVKIDFLTLSDASCPTIRVQEGQTLTIGQLKGPAPLALGNPRSGFLGTFFLLGGRLGEPAPCEVMSGTLRLETQDAQKSFRVSRWKKKEVSPSKRAWTCETDEGRGEAEHAQR